MSNKIEIVNQNELLKKDEPTPEELLAFWNKAKEVVNNTTSIDLSNIVDEDYQGKTLNEFSSVNIYAPAILIEDASEEASEPVLELIASQSVQTLAEIEHDVEEAIIDHNSIKLYDTLKVEEYTQPDIETIVEEAINLQVETTEIILDTIDNDPVTEDVQQVLEELEVVTDSEEDEEDETDIPFEDQLLNDPITPSAEELAEMAPESLPKNAIIDIPFESTHPINEDQQEILSESVSEEDKLGATNILPSTTPKNLQSFIGKALIDIYNNATINNSEASEAKAEFLRDLVSYVTGNTDTSSVAEGIFKDPNATLRQGIVLEEGGLPEGLKEFKLKDTGKKSVGERAIVKVIRKFGAGAQVLTHLPMSNIWLVFTPPLETDIAMWYNHFTRVKAQFGKMTMGYTYTNMSVVANKELFMFALKYVSKINLDIPSEDLWEKMKHEDLNAFFWGFFTSIYIEGFLFRRACVEHEKGCNELHEINAEPTSFLWVDNSKYTTKQKELIKLKKEGSYSLESFNIFNEEFGKSKYGSFTHRDITFNLELPSVKDYFDDGYEWLGDITARLEEALSTGKYLEEEEGGLLNQFLLTTKARNLSHYIASIVIDGDVTTDRIEITDIITSVAGNRGFNKAFKKAVEDFRKDVITYSLGVPEYKCPNCNVLQTKSVDNDEPNITAVIPIDAWNVFFLMCITKYHMAASDLVED